MLLSRVFADDELRLSDCDSSVDEWQYRVYGHFFGFAVDSFMGCWKTGSGWRGPYEADGNPLRKVPLQTTSPAMGCVWIKSQV